MDLTREQLETGRGAVRFTQNDPGSSLGASPARPRPIKSPAFEA